MSDLLKLENIQKRNGDIKAFPLGSNLTTSKTSKNGWGEVSIAVDNESVLRLATDKVIGVLYIVGRDDWEIEKCKWVCQRLRIGDFKGARDELLRMESEGE